MRVFIVGGGAVGTWFGDQMRELGCEVEFATRVVEEMDPIDAELAVVAVKAFDTPGAIRSLQAGLHDPAQTTILCLQNGIGNEETIAAAFGRDNVVAGALTVPIERRPNGKIVAAAAGGIGIAPLGNQAHNWLIALLQRMPHEILVANSAASLKWSKLALNLVTNAVSAITDLEPFEVVADSRLFSFELRALRELRDVMKAMNAPIIDLPEYPVTKLIKAAGLPQIIAHNLLAKRFSSGRGEKIPSFLKDIRSKRKLTEVTFLNGAVAREGQRLGVKTPVNTTVTRILEEIAVQPDIWKRYRGNPAALAAEIRTK